MVRKKAPAKSPKAVKKIAGSRSGMTKRQTRLLEGAMMGGFAFVIGSVFLMSSLQNFFMATNQFASVVSSVLVDLANTDRAAYNLGGLTVNPTLTKAAQAKADDMAAKGYFAHNSPDGVDSWHWFKQAGYDFQHAGENLAVDFSDSADVERAWMNSPTHRDNILNNKYTEVGIATASGFYQGKPTVFVVQMFGSPRSGAAIATAGRPQFETSPTNPSEMAVASNEASSPVLGSQIDSPEPDVAVAPAPAVQTALTQENEPVVVKDTQLSTETARLSDLSTNPANDRPIGAIVRESNDWEVLATSPSTALKYSYYLLALLVLLALAIDTGLEIKWHHRGRAASAGAMLALMFGLFWYADTSMFQKVHVVEANTIAVSR
jgi:uncharacterized protein YkwD